MRTIYEHPHLYALLSEEARAHDLPFYLGLAAARGARDVLEYGVGSGRVAIPLARAGARVVGVDRARPMLVELAVRLAREGSDVAARVSTRCADARDLSLGERFDLVLVPFNGLAEILADGGAAPFFARVRDHLRPGGALAFDVAVPDPRLWRGVRSTTPWFRDAETGQLSRCHQQLDYDAPSGVLTVRTESRAMDAPSASHVFALKQRQLHEDEVRTLLAIQGFDLAWRTTGFSLVDESPTLPSDGVAFVAEPRGGDRGSRTEQGGTSREILAK
jgi:SAM-dependent methyltransferase